MAPPVRMGRNRWVRRPASPASRPASRRRRRKPPAACAAARRAVATSRRRSGSAARAASAWTKAPRRSRCRSRPARRTAMPQPAPQPQRARLSMTLIRPDGTEGGTHDLRPGENKLGRSFGPVFENDGYLSPVHAMLDIRGQQRGRPRPRQLERRVREDDRRRGAAVRPDHPHRPGAAALRGDPDARADRRRHRAHGQPEPGLLGQAHGDHRPRGHRRGVPAPRRERHARPRARRDQLPRRRLRLRACTRASRCAMVACSSPTSAARTARS